MSGPLLLGLLLLAAGGEPAPPQRATKDTVKLLNLDAPIAERIAAAKALGASGDPLAGESLLQVLDTRNEELRRAAIGALKQLHAERRFVALLNDANAPWFTRERAANGLRYMQLPETVGALIKALDAPEAKVRAAAALALTVFGTEQAEPALVRLVDDDDSYVRTFAVVGLGSLKSATARSAVEGRLKVETDEAVRSALLRAQNRQRSP